MKQLWWHERHWHNIKTVHRRCVDKWWALSDAGEITDKSLVVRWAKVLHNGGYWEGKDDATEYTEYQWKCSHHARHTFVLVRHVPTMRTHLWTTRARQAENTHCKNKEKVNTTNTATTAVIIIIIIPLLSIKWPILTEFVAVKMDPPKNFKELKHCRCEVWMSSDLIYFNDNLTNHNVDRPKINKLENDIRSVEQTRASLSLWAMIRKTLIDVW